MYRVIHKRISDIAGKVVMVEEDILADSAQATESGVLVLVRYPEDGPTRAVKLIPPGMWFSCDEVHEASSLVNP